MTNEKKRWLKQTAAVILAIVEKRKYSQETIRIAPGEPWFEESCNYVGLVSDLQEFAATLKNMIKFSELSEEE